MKQNVWEQLIQILDYQDKQWYHASGTDWDKISQHRAIQVIRQFVGYHDDTDYIMKLFRYRDREARKREHKNRKTKTK